MTPDQVARLLNAGGMAADAEISGKPDELFRAVLHAMADEAAVIHAETAVDPGLPVLPGYAAEYAADSLCRHCGVVVWKEPGGAWRSYASGTSCARNPRHGHAHEPRSEAEEPVDAAYGEAFGRVLCDVVEALGHDPDDPRVLAVITNRLRLEHDEAAAQRAAGREEST